MRKYIKNLIIAGISALALYHTPALYRMARGPKLIETRQIDGIEVRIVQSKSKSEIINTLDDILLERKPFHHYTKQEGIDKADTTIDISFIEEEADYIISDLWKDCESNDCGIKEKLAYNLLKGYKNKEEARKALIDEIKKAVIAHEREHARRRTHHVLQTRKESEEAAYLKEFEVSPYFTLICLESILEKSFSFDYIDAASAILNKLKPYGKLKELADKPQSELSKIAKEIYDKEYQKSYPDDLPKNFSRNTEKKLP